MSGYDADVIVAGAGFSGLSAADALVSAGLDVIVLEARDRVGGRVEAMAFADGVAIDTGGQFICDEMPNVMALTRRFSLPLVETPLEGNFLVQPQAFAETGSSFAESGRIRARANRIDPRDPGIAGLTAGEWLARQNDPPGAKASYQAMVEGLWCRAIGEIPLWYLIDNDRRTISNGNELQYFAEGTIHAAAEALAVTLGQRLRLETPVVGVARRDGAVSVTTGKGDVLTARQVIIAVPPVMASRIAHEPDLPQPLAGALGVWQSGTVIKALVRYKRPFWRERGLSGMIMWRDTLGLFACDVSSVQATALVIFAGGPLAAAWSAKGRAFIEAEIRRRLVEALGAEAADVAGLLIRDWVDDPWSGGGYSDVISDLQAYDAEDILRAGLPPVHFASSELASSFPAYIEGAIVAGREAAARVIAAL
ncbi:monoamine oxidase [Rhizobium sp. Root73]|uniref:flavin monoamine oxidase family protein n=1 Tax=unclassified Rhizobium TaxID=2613769 RepID=UPI000712C6E9|nr:MULTISPECIES: FAD-dependent oxidoreductase [unclassified Rhizobium]KQV28703.1 monoamine oxidase [Rhizobium sp. Root1204]KQY05189.1 monoamine oxidase [Rhizobium sp. Root1334]KRC01809.1 monoamine oxidase [Rhizobium sp. Root73]